MYVVNASITIKFFMDEIASKGTPVYLDETCEWPQHVTTERFNSFGTERHLIGILASNVVNKDLTRYCIDYYSDEVQKGSKVNIITSGVIMIQLLKRYTKLQIGSMLYWNNRSWRKAKSKEDAILITLSPVDERGFVKCQILKR